ncbi:uncharacterized protein LOC117896157 [Drosophila subobscura]|uniref:uncharacterized protein LOC117896157 n=1 Tax=Drosophila subobscura TaxID=7241 RepID=UPI00155B0F17|nr:uncharacterized protein LOC117896157 [Drosophila subobscura]
MSTPIGLYLLLSFLLVICLQVILCDDVPSAEADTVITQSEPTHTTPDDFHL